MNMTYEDIGRAVVSAARAEAEWAERFEAAVVARIAALRAEGYQIVDDDDEHKGGTDGLVQIVDYYTREVLAEAAEYADVEWRDHWWSIDAVLEHTRSSDVWPDEPTSPGFDLFGSEDEAVAFLAKINFEDEVAA